ncbi:MAG: TolC family protein [Bacteroidota bacterium]
MFTFKNERLTVLFFLLLCTFSSIAQPVDYKKVVLPSNVSTTDFGERLVQIAWQNFPDNNSVKADVEVAQLKLKNTRWSWLNQISATGNLNEITLDQDLVDDNNLFFPRYNFNLSLPLGIFVNASTNSKIAKKELDKADYALKKQMLMIREEVLKAYQDYLMYQDIYKIKNDLAEEEYSNFLTVEQNFQSGEASLSEYKEATKSYNLELENKITAQNRLGKSKLTLEKWIGIRLEDVN